MDIHIPALNTFMYYQDQSKREVWHGHHNKNLAHTHVKKIPFLHFFLYEGRVGGKKTTDVDELKKAEVSIVAKLYNLKPA